MESHDDSSNTAATPTLARITPVELPVSRSRVFARGVIWGAAAVALGLLTKLVFGGLRFTPSGLSNRVVDYSIALLMLPVAFAALACAAKTLLWLGVALWPGHLGVCVSEDDMTVRLGPFGTHCYDADRLDVRYPSELPEDLADSVFESYLPEEEQRARHLPRLMHPEATEPLNWVILRFATGSEAQIVSALRPVIDVWRARQGSSSD